MKKNSATVNKGILKILKESFSLYFRNIFRLIEIVAWIGLPASIFFVLIFYWGLPEQVLYKLGAISYPAALVLLLLLSMVVLKTIQALDEGRPVQTLMMYAQAFPLFFHYIWVLVLVTSRIFLWSIPFAISILISFKIQAWKVHAGPLAVYFLGSALFLIPVFIVVCYYAFSSVAFLVDGKCGMEALRISKKLIKGNFGKFVGTIFLLSFLMQPVYKLISWGIDRVQSLPLLAVNLFPLIFYNCLVNLLALTAGIFPMVLLYFFYKKFRSEENFIEGRE